MPGTIRKIIDRIKEVRSGGNSVVALTVETRLVLQGFDPERFGYDAPDDAARLARIRDIAAELGIDIDDLLAEADVAPDPDATPGPMPSPPVRSSAAAAAAQASSEALAAAGAASTSAIRASGGGEADTAHAHEAAASSAAPGAGGLADADPEEVAAQAARPGLDGLADASEGAAHHTATPGLDGLADAEPDIGIEDDHPLHEFRRFADEILADLGAGSGQGQRTGASFAVLMKASLLMALYSVSSDQALCDHIRHNTLYRWFLGLGPGEGRYDTDAFRQDREAALAAPAGRAFFDRLVPKAGSHGLFRSERLQVNGRQIKGWMSKA